jgi:hypothetical protein
MLLYLPPLPYIAIILGGLTWVLASGILFLSANKPTGVTHMNKTNTTLGGVTSKPEMQRLLTRLRQAGYTVTRTPSGSYRVTDMGECLVMKATAMGRSYLYSYTTGLFHSKREG